jgi:hypothetical protein
MRTLLFASLAAALLLAGCAGSTTSSTTTTGAPGTPSAFAPPEVIPDKGTITASASVPMGASFAIGVEGAKPGVANVSLLYIELRWTGPADLNLCVDKPSSASTGGQVGSCEPEGAGGLPGMPDSPVHVTYLDPEEGEWDVSPYANGGAANTPYELAVTLFHGEREVPQGYTAFT